MLSNALRFFVLCYFCSSTLQVHGQVFVDVFIGKDEILKNKTSVVAGQIIVQVTDALRSGNTPIDGLQLSLKFASIKGTPEKGIQNGIGFDYRLGTTSNANRIGLNTILLLCDKTTKADSYSNGLLFNFDFYIEPNKILEVMEPGTYIIEYDIGLVSPTSLPKGVRFDLMTKKIQFRVTVGPYVIIEPVSINPIQIIIDDFSFFNDGYRGSANQAVRQSYKFKTNTPFDIAISTLNDQFDFIMGVDRNKNTDVKNVNTIVTIGNRAPVKIALAKKSEKLRVNDISTGGYTTVNFDFEILPEQLRAGFFRAGNYSSLTKVLFSGDLIGGPLVTLDFKALEVIVKPLSNLRVNRKSVDLILQTPNDYQNGVSAMVEDNLTFSSTSKYNITVKAGTENFVGLNDFKATMSCGVLYIGSTDQSGNLLNEIQLSTSPKNILAGDTAFETNSGIRYRIKPSPELIISKKGSHTIEVIYGITAQ